MTDYVEYSRKVDGVHTNIEVDGDGGVDIEYTQYYDYGSCPEMLNLGFDEIEKAYFTAKAHRDAYQAYRERGFENPEQYELDFGRAMVERN